jgi:hypothetical protein
MKKNITIAVTDAVYHDARVWAARRNTSISATVQDILENLPILSRAMRAMLEADMAALGITPTPPAPQSPVNPSIQLRESQNKHPVSGL